MDNNYVLMTETEMLAQLDNINKNLSYGGDRELYSQMLVLLDNIRYFLKQDLEIDYPKEYYDVLNNFIAKEGNFEF